MYETTTIALYEQFARPVRPLALSRFMRRAILYVKMETTWSGTWMYFMAASTKARVAAWVALSGMVNVVGEGGEDIENCQLPCYELVLDPSVLCIIKT